MSRLLPEPFFLQASSGSVFSLYLPAEGKARGAFLYLPPFAEEMNRCRSTAAQQAHELCKLGYSCLLLDPYGTGDSHGDLTDADWQIWLADVSHATEWLEEQTGEQVTLWAFRLGALLATHAANKHPGRFKQLLLWQPVLDGKLFLTQYLRLRVAYLMDRGLPQETTDSMREMLGQGHILEVAGYPIGKKLAESIDQARLANLTTLTELHIDWLELVSEANKPVSPGTQKAVAQLSTQHCTVNMVTFTGPPIWQLHKRDTVPELIQRTTELVKGWSS